MGWGAVGESPWLAPVEVGEVGGEQRIRKVLLLARRPLSNLPSPTSQSPESGGVCSPRSHLGGWEAPRHRRRPAQVTAPRPRRRRRPPLETSPGARSSDLSEPKRLPAEEEGLKDLPLEKLPPPLFLLLSLRLHPSSRLSTLSCPLPSRDLGHPDTNFSANFAACADGRFCSLLGSVKLCGVGSPQRGFLPASLCQESAQNGRRSRLGDESSGALSPMLGVLSPYLGLMGTNQRESGSVNHCNIEDNF